MIFVGNVRGNGQNLARHLMSSENEHVTVHEVLGFVGDDLAGAFKEAEATARGTRCQKYLYSLSLNPPSTENVQTEIFLEAISRVEDRLGLAGQPRAVVFHEKDTPPRQQREGCNGRAQRLPCQGSFVIQNTPCVLSYC